MNQQEKLEFTPVDFDELGTEESVHAMIEMAADLHASDLFIGTDEDATDVSVKHLGIVRPLHKFTRDQGRLLINHVKAVAGMDIADHRRPDEGRWIFRTDTHTVDLRINSIPTQFGEDVAIRLLDRQAAQYKLTELGMLREEYDVLLGMLTSPSGLILVSGPTGSGKTTTLYACLKFLNNGERKINTLEDPIEYSLPGVRQSQVNPRLGNDFPDLLPHVLRQSPDVIMIGEIRDPKTAEIAVRAANSGHMVLATLHAPIASAGVQSMSALGVHPHFLSTSLLGVVSQRLVRTLCENCRQQADMGEDFGTFDEVRPLLTESEGRTIYAPGGCDECHHSGYTGRVGVFEVMQVSPGVRKLILEQRPAREVEAQAIADGMVEFRRSALVRVAEGKTSSEEIIRVVPTEYLVEEF